MLTATRAPAGAVTGHPLATDAARDVLGAGGTAMDAAVAAALVLTVVEPQHAGLVGGAVALWVPLTGRPAVVVGRERASQALAPGAGVWSGGGRIAVPALLPALGLGARTFGRRPWAELVAPAAAVARRGFAVGTHLAVVAGGLGGEDGVAGAGLAAAFGPLAPGAHLRQPGAADALDEIARRGAPALAEGWLAEDVLAGVAAAGGTMTAGDLAGPLAYVASPALAYAHDWLVIGPPAPSWGTAAVAGVLGGLAEAPRGPDRVVTTVALLAQAYAGHGVFRHGPRTPADSTTHVAVRDRDGNLASLTLSVGSPFGARHLTPRAGLVLNDSLTDFDHTPPAVPEAAANHPAPGARPRTSMTPLVLVHGDGRRLAAGGAGGKQIPAALAQALDHVVWGGADLQEAVDRPRAFVPVRPTQAVRVEAGFDAAGVDALRAAGHRVEATGDRWSCVHLLAASATGASVAAGADPRRDGAGEAWA